MVFNPSENWDKREKDLDDLDINNNKNFDERVFKKLDILKNMIDNLITDNFRFEERIKDLEIVNKELLDELERLENYFGINT